MDFGKILDYPEYKAKYPDKTMGDWQKYRGKIVYREMKKELAEHADKMTKEDLEDLQKDLNKLRQKYID